MAAISEVFGSADGHYSVSIAVYQPCQCGMVPAAVDRSMERSADALSIGIIMGVLHGKGRDFREKLYTISEK